MEEKGEERGKIGEKEKEREEKGEKKEGGRKYEPETVPENLI